MAGANDDAIVVALEGVHVSLSRFAVLRLRAHFPAAGKPGKVPDNLRKGEPTEIASDAAHRVGAPLANAGAKFSSPNAVIPHRHGRPIGENEGRPEGDAGARIVAAHDRGHVVAADE